MNKTTKILFVIAFLLLAISSNAQQNCGVVCHNGRLLTGVNEHAIERHIAHGDTFITDDCDYVETGNECDTLSVPKFTFSKTWELGLKFYIVNLKGQIIQKGFTNVNLKRDLPKNQQIILTVETYQPTKFYME